MVVHDFVLKYRKVERYAKINIVVSEIGEGLSDLHRRFIGLQRLRFDTLPPFFFMKLS